MSTLALQQLTELVEVSQGAIQLLNTETDEKGVTTFTVSLDTSGIASTETGIKVRARERFQILVDDSFPLTHPPVLVEHRRWAGTPHVQWARSLCLYAAPSVEWNPADGMRGLISRLNSWVQAAAAGTLDPDGQPLHPPVAYSSYQHGSVLVQPDVGDLAPWTQTGEEPAQVHYAWCERRGTRVDVLEWLTLREACDRFVAGTLPVTGEEGAARFAAPFVLISGTLDMEYPDTADALATALDGHGITRDALLNAIVTARALNKLLGVTLEGEDAAPGMMLLGTPARRLEDDARLAHITAWKFDDLGAKITGLLEQVSPEHTELKAEVRDFAHSWLGFANVRWMVIHEARPEVTRRRDTGSPMQWLSGKKVLVLGCGALGAPIAEQCVRAGVSALHVIDKSAVHPGILLRQPYDDADIGYNKAERLAPRLSRIRRNLTVTASRTNVLTGILTEPETLLGYDLIIDATADVGVRVGIERARMALRDQWPATISALFGHTAQRGVATIAQQGATGSGHDILRRLAIDTTTTAPAGWGAITEDLFPNPPRTKRFFPEPGCSAPTFTGSAAETTALASSLFLSAITTLTNPDAVPMTAIGIDLAPEATGPRPVPIGWRNDHVVRDHTGAYEVRINARALAEMRTEARRGVRVRGERIETGGMLLGSIDDATGTIIIDTATGPSPDSHLSALFFDHGTQGTQEIVNRHRQTTANRIGFTGMWHTHPYGIASPSATDEAGMADIVSPDGTSRRALMLILGGPTSTWENWLRSGTLPDLYVRVIDRSATGHPTAGEAKLFATSPGPWYPGGYAYPSIPRGSRRLKQRGRS